MSTVHDFSSVEHWASGADDRGSLQVPLANRVVFQVDHEISYTIQKLKRQKFASSPIDTRKLSRAIDLLF